jgi:hypothetical protein
MYKGFTPPPPSVSNNAYIAIEDGDFDDFGLTGVSAGDLICPSNNGWAINPYYSKENLRIYII